MNIDFNSPEFRKLIKARETEINDQTENIDLVDSSNFKRLRALIISTSAEAKLTGLLAVVISNDDIGNLQDDVKGNLLAALTSHEAAVNDYLRLDSSLALVDCSNKRFQSEDQAHEFYSGESESAAIFVISKLGVNPFVSGKYRGTPVFLTEYQQGRFRKLKEMDNILELFDEFRAHIGIRHIYSNFFVRNSGKRALRTHLSNNGNTVSDEKTFLIEQAQLLNNKPEDQFRESLRIFLKGNLLELIDLSKERILEDFKRLDINIFDNYGDIFFIEVKWIGNSIHADGDDFGTSFGASDISPAGVTQTVEYIRNLHTMGAKLKRGYLVVFDARAEDLDDSIDGFDIEQMPAELHSFYPHFTKVPDFRVRNEHPI